MARRKHRKDGGREAAPTLEGHVLPIRLGQEGVVVAAGRRRLTLPAGVPGDRVRVRPDPNPRAPAELRRLLEPSPERITPPCPLLQRCGGCSLQAMGYRAQLQAKSEALNVALRELGADEATVTGLDRPFGQRTKLMMTASGRAGALRLGFYRRGTMELVPAEGCPVQHPQSLAVLASARQVLDAHRVAPSDGRDGWLHAVGVRVDPRGGESELTLSATSGRLPRRELAQQLAAIPTVSGVHLAVNPGRTSYPMEGPMRTLAGRPRTAFHLGQQRHLLSPGAFFQTSADGAERLLELVCSLLPSRPELLADLYAGAGQLALGTRTRWRRAVALESNPAAVTDLQRHLEHERITGLTALHGRVEDHIDEVLDREPDAVLLDPPRRGCAPAVIHALVRRPVPVLLYIACGFDALLTQARQLTNGGYRISGAGAVDMFPHTAHLETVLRFERPS